MKNNRFLFAALICVVPFLVQAQSINYTKSWLGATFDGGPNTTVMSFIDQMQVSTDGTVHTFSGWDESVGGGRNTNSKDGVILNRSGFTIHCHQITDNNSNTWTIMHPSDEVNNPYPTGNDTIKCSDGRVITDVDGPTSLAISNDGKLMVGQYGRLSQIRYYNISVPGTPALVRTFGDNLGYLSGDIPGRLGNLRFREIRGVGEDGAGNIYVGMSSFFGGCKLQSYTPAGKKNWELNGLMFVDNGEIDPATDGRDFYTKSHHFVWDSTKPAGQEWIDTAYTLNRYDYPDDSRLNTVTRNPTVTAHPSSTWIRYFDGKKFQIVNDMFSEQFRMYRFDSSNGEIAIPSVFYARWNLLPWIGNIRDFKINNNPTVLATNFDARHGTSPGTTEVGGIQPGQWLAFDSIDFGTVDTSTFTVNYSCVDPWPACRIEIHADAADGRIIGNLQTARTGSNDVFKLFTTKLSDTITGIHRLVLVFRHPTPNKWPATQPSLGQWLWSDANGNGKMDTDEYQNIEVNNESVACFWVDKAMNLWMGNPTAITKVPFTGLGAKGNPTYNLLGATTIVTPSHAGSLKRFEYDSDNDIMYIISETKAAKYSNWSTNKTTPDWVIPILGSQCMKVAGDYLFTIEGSTSIVYAYKLQDGKYAGKITPNSPVGLVDIPYGLSAFKRSNGEYIVTSEEDYLGKVRVYRFSTFNPNTPPVVNITKPTANQELLSASNLVTAIASDIDGSIVKVQIFIDSVKVSDVRTYTWLNATPGEHTIFARAFDNYGDSTTSDSIHIRIITTGISPQESQRITVYPNPANDKVYIKTSENYRSINQISIMDLSGKTIFLRNNLSNRKGNSEIDVSGFSNGVYILKYYSQQKLQIQKLVIKR